MSRSEIIDGSAVVGRWDQKVPMPPGIAAEAIRGGMKPGSALKIFTPTRVAALLKKYDARQLYDEFEAEIDRDCGGSSLSGWDSKKIYEKVQQFQGRFNEKKIRVCFHMVTWQQWVSSGQYGGSMQTHYRYWMTYADMEAYAVSVGDAFDPSIDYNEGVPTLFSNLAKRDSTVSEVMDIPDTSSGSKQAW